MKRFTLILAAACLSAGSASADQPQVDRTILKEPAYKTKSPKYGLLLFSSNPKHRVWLVLDGDTLYVDRNGNGDLTEPGEKIVATKRTGGDPEEDGYSFDVGELNVGGRIHKALRVGFALLKRYASSMGKRPDVKAALEKDAKALVASMSLDVDVPDLKGGGLGGRVAYQVGTADLTGVFQFADAPAQAPVVHFGGPLEVTFYSGLPTLRVGRATELDLVVGTPGIGPGTFAMIGYQDTVPATAVPFGVITYPSAKPGDPPVKDVFEITDRC